MRSTSVGSATSPATATSRSLPVSNSEVQYSSNERSMSLMSTRAPSSRKARAIAWPMPRPAPVTMARLPVSLPAILRTSHPSIPDRPQADLARATPTIDDQCRAGYETGEWRGEQHDGVGDILWFADTERNTGTGAFFIFLAERRATLIDIDETWKHGVRANLVFRQFQRHRFGEQHN